MRAKGAASGGEILGPGSDGGATWRIALLTLLATMFVIGAGALDHADNWLSGPNANTITVTFSENRIDGTRGRFGRLARRLVATDGVVAFRRTSGARNGVATTFVEVFMDPGAPRRNVAAAEIAKAVPGAEIDDPLSAMGAAAWWVGPARFAAILLALLLVAWLGLAIRSLAARMMPAHAAEIRIATMLGATRAQIARLFERRLSGPVLWTSIAGALFTVLVFFTVRAQMNAPFPATIDVPLTVWLVVALAPMILALLCRIVVRLTIRWRLRTSGI